MKLLIVDDETSLGEMVEDILVSKKIFGSEQICRASNGQEGLEIFQREKPELVISDIVMPEMDGTKMSQKIHDLNPESSIILMSGYAEFEMAIRIIRTGAVDFLRKPFAVEELVASVQSALMKKRLRDENVAMRLKLIQSEKMGALGLLAAGVAHEINNPATFIKGNLEWLDRRFDPASEGNVPILEAIRSSLVGIERIRGIVSSLSSNCRNTDMVQDVSLKKTLGETLILASHRLKPHSVEAAIPDNLIVRSTSQQIFHIFTNLLVNAADAIEERQKNEKNLAGRIEVGASVSEGKASIVVKDNGAGMDESTLQNCLNPFFTTKPVGKGTGLGLWIVRDSIESMGGELHVSSRKNEGSEFTLRLPIALST